MAYLFVSYLVPGKILSSTLHDYLLSMINCRAEIEHTLQRDYKFVIL